MTDPQLNDKLVLFKEKLKLLRQNLHHESLSELFKVIYI